MPLRIVMTPPYDFLIKLQCCEIPAPQSVLPPSIYDDMPGIKQTSLCQWLALFTKKHVGFRDSSTLPCITHTIQRNALVRPASITCMPHCSGVGLSCPKGRKAEKGATPRIRSRFCTFRGPPQLKSSESNDLFSPFSPICSPFPVLHSFSSNSDPEMCEIKSAT